MATGPEADFWTAWLSLVNFRMSVNRPELEQLDLVNNILRNRSRDLKPILQHADNVAPGREESNSAVRLPTRSSQRPSDRFSLLGAQECSRPSAQLL